MLYRLAILSLMASALIVLGGAANAYDDSLKGGRLFKRCTPCHSLTVGKHKSGPSLNGVLGRRAGTVPGFHYSRDLTNAGEKGLVWTRKTVHDFIGDPKGFLREFLGKRRAKTKMRRGYKDHKFRDAVVTHLENSAGNSAR